MAKKRELKVDCEKSMLEALEEAWAQQHFGKIVLGVRRKWDGGVTVDTAARHPTTVYHYTDGV